MKLLMVTGLGSIKDLVSGKKGAFYNTLEEFHKHWDRIDIISPKIKGAESNEAFFGNVHVHISPWPLLFHPIWFLKKALDIYKEQKFDLMTVQDFAPFYNGIGARLLWQVINVPYILEIHHITGYPEAATIKENIYRILARLFIDFDSKKSKAVRVVNEGQVPDFLIEAGVPKEKIIYIPSLYIDTDLFKPRDTSKEYDLIFVGRLEANKGIELFLDTVKKLNCRAIMVGDGSRRDSCVSFVRDNKLSEKVKIYGWAKDQMEIAQLLDRSKILVMPSYNEGGPRVVAEALACGVPVLATPVGIVPDLLKNGQGGEIIAWEVDDIASKASRLFEDKSRYEAYSLSGIEMVKKFEKRAGVKNYADKIKELI